MPPEDRVRLLHIKDALETVQRMVSGRRRADLETAEVQSRALLGLEEMGF